MMDSGFFVCYGCVHYIVLPKLFQYHELAHIILLTTNNAMLLLYWEKNDVEIYLFQQTL